LHFMLVVLCLLPDLLVLMAETHVIHNDIVYTKVIGLYLYTLTNHKINHV
jgi:hypothetical protein